MRYVNFCTITPLSTYSINVAAFAKTGFRGLDGHIGSGVAGVAPKCRAWVLQRRSRKRVPEARTKVAHGFSRGESALNDISPAWDERKQTGEFSLPPPTGLGGFWLRKPTVETVGYFLPSRVAGLKMFPARGRKRQAGRPRHPLIQAPFSTPPDTARFPAACRWRCESIPAIDTRPSVAQSRPAFASPRKLSGHHRRAPE